MLILWNEFLQHPVIKCSYCDSPIASHRAGLVGWPACDQPEPRCVVIHPGCKPLFEAGQGKFIWLPAEDFLWLLADGLGLLKIQKFRTGRRRGPSKRGKYRE